MADTVWMIDPTGKTRGTIRWNDYTAVERHRQVGAWTVNCPLTPDHVQAAAAGWRILIADGADTVICGPVTRARIGFDGTSGRVRRTLTLSGTDDMRWLEGRRAWPNPSANINSQTPAYDVRTGVASTVIRNYVAANAGPTATHTDRRVPGLTLAADPVVGSSVTGRARFTNLLELIDELAVRGAVSGVELGFRVESGFGTSKTFRVFLPADRTGPAKFSIGLRNLKSLTWELVAPEATSMLSGGAGEDTTRDFDVVDDVAAQATWGMYEDFYDYRGATAAELQAATNTRLIEQAETRSVDVQPIDTDQLRYRRDYGLGDIVTVDVGYGITLDEVVREVEITNSRERGKIVRPKVGTIGTAAGGRQWSRLRDALARLDGLETRR